eukprot:Em0006g962a
MTGIQNASHLVPRLIWPLTSCEAERSFSGLRRLKNYMRSTMKEDRLNGLEKAAGCDDEQRMLAQVIGQGWPTTIREVSALVRLNWNFRDTMVVQDATWAASQPSEEPEMQSIGLRTSSRSFQNASNVKRMCKEPQLAHSIPKYPWSKVGIDLCRCKRKDWVVMVDYLTDFIEVSELQQTLATTVIDAIKQHFARHSVPGVVHTNGGSQFTSQEFQAFSRAWEFVHTISSPYHSQSNGKVESAVKIVK